MIEIQNYKTDMILYPNILPGTAGILKEGGMNEQQFEKLEEAAEIVHNIWKEWMDYFFKITNGGRLIKESHIAEWERDMVPFGELDEIDKEHLRKAAEKYVLPIMK